MADIKKQEEESKKIISGDRDQVILEQILREKKLGHAEAHIGGLEKESSVFYKNPDVEWKDTDKFRIAMVMAPSWGVLFPPYNIAKLTALLRNDQFSVKVYDINVECYHYLLKEYDQDFWRSEKYFYWTVKTNFIDHVLPKISKVLDNAVDDILKSNTKVVGFSLYNTNLFATLYMAKKIRAAKPDICLLVGGPETITGYGHFEARGDARNLFNYIFVGESEENILEILNNLPDELPFNQIIGSTESRLNLNKYPFPDYTDYNLENYLERGISMETSRGCIAQCSFCAETYFWNFRSLTPERIVEEIEYQVKNHRIHRVWFVDSLINGNVKVFKQLVDLILEKMDNGIISILTWNSYARCDGRMDAEFFTKIKKSGGGSLSFGVESGSQKILDDMRKKVDVWEVENNLRDSVNANIFTHVNWIIGFATEEAVDHFHSMQLLFNVRKHIDAISPGMTAGISLNSHTQTHPELYNIKTHRWGVDTSFLNAWYTKDYKNNCLNRFLRLKMFHIWLKLLSAYKHSRIINAQQHVDLDQYYSFSFGENLDIDYLEQDFNVNFEQFGNDLNGIICNEYVAFCFLLTKYFKSVKFEFICDYAKDLSSFGDFLVRDYNCTLKFETDDNNNYTLSIDHKLQGHFECKEERTGNISDWQTREPIVRETIHEQYRKKQQNIQT